MNNKFSFQVNAADQKAIDDALKVLDEKLFANLIALNDKERQTINKMSDKSLAFVEKSLHYSKAEFKEVMKTIVNTEEFEIDLAAYRYLQDLELRFGGMVRKLTDSSMVAGSEALNAANLVYGTLKLCIKKSTPGAQDAYNELGTRYKKTSPKLAKPKGNG